MRKVLDKKTRSDSEDKQKANTNASHDNNGKREVSIGNSEGSRSLSWCGEGDKVGEDVQRVRHAGGRPNGYKPEFCKTIIELAKKGDFKKTWGLSCISEERPNGVCFDTLHEWAKTYPEFSDAFKIASAYSEAYWLNLSKEQASEYPDASSGRGARNHNATKFMLSACYGYREKSDLDVTSNGNSILNYIQSKRGQSK